MGIFIGFWLGHKATVQFDRKHIYETIEACGLTLDELHRVNRYMADKANDEPDQLPQVLVRVDKHNDTFYAYPEQIPVEFRKSLECISPPEVQAQAKRESEIVFPKETLYVVEPTKAKGWFNVVNQMTKKAINEKTLSQEKAEKLCTSLNV